MLSGNQVCGSTYGYWDWYVNFGKKVYIWITEVIMFIVMAVPQMGVVGAQVLQLTVVAFNLNSRMDARMYDTLPLSTVEQHASLITTVRVCLSVTVSFICSYAPSTLHGHSLSVITMLLNSLLHPFTSYSSIYSSNRIINILFAIALLVEHGTVAVHRVKQQEEAAVILARTQVCT